MTGCKEGIPEEGTRQQEQKEARAFAGQGGVGKRGQINEIIPFSQPQLLLLEKGC